MKKILFLSLCVLQLSGMELLAKKDKGLFVPHKLGYLDLARTDEGYDIIKDDFRHKVNNYDIDPLLKKLDKKKLAAFLAMNAGHIEVSQLSNVYYKLKIKVHGDGGFLLTGVTVYNTVKYTGYIAYGVGSVGAITGALVTAGPAGTCAAYAGSIAALPTVAAGIESGALMVGTVASFIPGLP